MLRDRIPTRELLRLLGYVVVSASAAALFAAGCMALVGCRPKPPAAVENHTHCWGSPERPDTHCPDMQLLVYDECEWRCV